MSDLLSLAESLAREAGAVLRRKFDEARTIEFKGEGRSDLVTDADRASEAVILARLARDVPQHAVLAEETGAVGQGAFTWFVDPLDGTTNYAHGVPHFSVTIAVEGPVPSGETALLAGVVFDPMRDELFAAARGQGATLNGRRLSTGTASSLDRALLCTGFPYDLHLHPEVPLGLFNRLVTQAQGMRRLGSAALDLAYVAAGRFDGYFEFGLKPWDTAAGALLVQEAGGRVCRIDGAPYEPRFGDLAASSRALGSQLTSVCAAFVKDVGWQPRRFGG